MINMLDAKTTLSKLVRAIETGEKAEIVIARNGRPAARLVPVRSVAPGKRIGVAVGRFVAPDGIDRDNATIAGMFGGDD